VIFRSCVLVLALACAVPAAAQPRDQFITVNNIRLHYLEWGDESKPPFIMLHGIARVSRVQRPVGAADNVGEMRHVEPITRPPRRSPGLGGTPHR